jgi:hypothetical protein
MLTRSLFPTLLVLVLLVSACKTISIPNTEVCAVAGVMSAGANCAETLSEKTREMTLDEFLEFLEPKEELRDEKTGKIIQAERAPAICQSATDWNALKTSLETACEKLGNSCTYDIRESISKMTRAIDFLQSKPSAKERPQYPDHNGGA